MTLNRELRDRQIPIELVRSINQSISELAREVEDIKPRKEQEIDYEKQKKIEAKTAGVIQRVLDALPTAAETATMFTPLYIKIIQIIKFLLQMLFNYLPYSNEL